MTGVEYLRSKYQKSMAILNSIFGKKKKEFKAACQVTREPLEKGFGYLLTTAQVVSSNRQIWINALRAYTSEVCHPFHAKAAT